MQFDSVQFLNEIPEAFCAVDASWNFVFVNRQAEALLKQGKEALLGKCIWDILPEAEDSPFHTEIRRIAHERMPGEFCALSASLQRWLSVRCYPVDDGVAFIVDYASDVSGTTTESRTRESYYRLLLNSTGEGIYAVDTYGKCTFINKAGAALLGFAPEELLGQKMHTLTHHTRSDGTEYPHSECHIYRAFRLAEDVQVDDELFWRKDGSSFDVQYSSYPVSLNGTIYGAVVAFNDITTRRETEVALRASEERFRSLVTTTAEIVWTTMPNGDFNREQNEWSRFTGQGSTQSVDWGWLEAVHPDDRERTKSTWLAAVESRSFYQHEHRLRRYDGLYRHMVVKAVPVINSNGSIREWIGIHTDITDRKTAEMERERLLLSERKARKEAEEAKHKALSLAGELSIERDKLNSSNDKLQGLVNELEAAGKSLYEKQERQALITRYLRAANKLAAQITGADSLSDKLESLVNTLRNDFRMLVAAVWISEPSGHMLMRAAEVGLSEMPSRALESQIDINIHSYKLGWVARLKRPFVSHDMTNDIQMDQEWIAEHKIISAAFFPLMDRERLLGVIAAFSRHELPIEGADIISTMAAVLAASMQAEQE